MTGTAVQTINRETGEVTTVESFDFPSYLVAIGREGLTRQQQFAAAYDAACHALIGPNDVQQEGDRTFKKKSAWRKLAKHFAISTSVIRLDKEWLGGAVDAPFVATVTVRASSPWGQYAEAVGACGTDEESGRRKITIADAIATAQTRASNRAISDLIAAGEVSAEEMNKTRRPGSASDQKSSADKVMPFGSQKGKRLREVDSEALRSTIAWCREKDAAKFERIIADCQAVLASRQENMTDKPEAFTEEEEDDDSLPF